MAERYGGKFSPKGSQAGDAGVKPAPGAPKVSSMAPRFAGATRARAGMRSNLMFVVPLVFLWHAFTSDPTGLALYLAAVGVLLLAAWLTREGLKAQEAWEARKVARRPGIPRKLFGSALTGAGLGLVGLAGHGVLEAVIFAILGAGLHGFAFGLDPMSDKGMEGIDTHQQDRVARAVGEAEAHLAAMADAVKRAGDRGVADRVARFSQTARTMFRTVEEDPRDLTAARKFMGVYLMGARDATVKFADFYARKHDPKAREDYLALLDEMESNYAQRTEKLLLDDKTDLDIEIEVLRERLQREGAV
ncbi:5-bromo-4-chloroindolyl phosphate hydrolysis family protein [Vannielia litorea]|uniref:5-bromo-4-chloroindolyl phosphate hydrolysis protein n=1 Tax=Vannielia litorea TaxID=1217970 RepID=A0A1N6EFE7_9RHOB|nr:5-bromo-4-chloroindolyl phosphate hydrolysis family protein [Vannielia litorea]SIN81795.1 5-bromo-4-chloroindolyl phosphate hydrolysis protein [Vannielia litorea]